MYARSLRKAGYEVTVVVTGQEGIDSAIAKHFDIILLDIMLPEKQGMEVLQELRKSGSSTITNTRIVVLTNFDQDDESRAAMENQADGYLIKANITPSKLVSIADSFMEQINATQ
jgi:DNA-binding response OmpR family regulator